MLRVEKINYEVNGRKLLKDITFQVRKGNSAILGANGAGKSTLMGCFVVKRSRILELFISMARHCRHTSLRLGQMQELY
jgi:ABC-type cobalamin/Fe3+-siderophores transport system ATPase subunit